jgi:hypothetical protein
MRRSDGVRKAGAAEAVLEVFEDKLEPPKPGSVKLRLINASPDAGELDLFTPGAETPLFAGVDYQHATDYAEDRFGTP